MISIARWASRMISVKSLANFVTAAEGGEEAAAAGAEYFVSQCVPLGTYFSSSCVAAAEITAEAEEAAEALDGELSRVSAPERRRSLIWICRA